MVRMRDRVRDVPVLGPLAMAAKRAVHRATFPGSRAYWERRYARGGTSGPGSYGRLAVFKAEVLNDFVATNDVRSVIEFGCGDGNQLSLATYPRYVGLDVSPTAVRLCATRFAGDPTKSFLVYDPTAFMDGLGVLRADLALSLDVLFHLTEQVVFDAHLRHLFASAERHVIIYGRDTDAREATVGYVRDRRFTPWVEANAPSWRLVERIPNRYPFDGDVGTTSDCDFFVYARG